ncbi:MAG: 50S ribosomal protein L25 [Candidatus Binatia bacterium]
METIDVPIEPREAGSKRAAGRLRREGKLPGVFYGHKTDPVPLQVSRKELSDRIAELEGSHIIRMKSTSALLEDKVALIKEVQIHPVTGDVIHLDLYEIDLTQKIAVKVPLHFVGKAQGVVKGGILQPVVREIEVECLPIDIPEFLDVDVSSLEIGQSLHVSDMQAPEDVLITSDSSTTIVTVVSPTIEEAPKVEEVPLVAPEEAAVPAPGEEEKKEEGKEKESPGS